VPNFIHRRQLRIEWGYCDPAGIVFNARFFEIFDAGTWALFEAALGVPRQELAAKFDIFTVRRHRSRIADSQVPPVELRGRAPDIRRRHAGGGGKRDAGVGGALRGRAARIQAGPAGDRGSLPTGLSQVF